MLREIRERKGLTQSEVARKAGVTEEYLSLLERGVRKNPSVAVLTRLAKALKVTLPELLN